MSERKNLDKLFQEKFKDFEPATPDTAWPYIEEKLKEKKKRRVIPIWWKLSGVAAVLLIGFALSDSYLNRSPKNNNGIVVRDNTNANDANSSSNGAAKESNGVENRGNQQTAVATSENPKDSNASPATQITPENDANSGIVANENASEKTETKTSEENNSIQKQPKLNPGVYQKERQLVVNDKAPKIRDSETTAAKNQTINRQSNPRRHSAENGQIAVNEPKPSNKSGHLKAAQTTDKDHAVQNRGIDQKPKAVSLTPNDNDSKIANQNPGNKTQPSENQTSQSAVNSKKTDPILDIPQSQLTQNENKKPVQPQDKKLDSTAIATVEPNALEKLLNEKENNLVTKEPHINRWQITSSVAPIYFGSTSNGSPIDSSFAGNSKSYKTNMSVRLGVNYAVNKKLTIRAGVSQVTLDYNTNDVMVYAGMQRNKLGNVDTNGQNQFLHFARKSSASRTAVAADAASIATNLATDQFASELNQRMGYLEVPIELSYAVVDKKFGLNVIGGVSTLFLNENKITVLSDGLTTNLGEANNLNKTHFSTNVGLGMRYRFYKAFQANFEPMFKYQINTFSKGDGNFKPYFLGLYTGVSYSF
jgi:Outer membrane protein beta-barrel domain